MAQIYITGDVHGTVDIQKISNFENIIQQSENPLTKEDYLIVLGDFGAFWHDDIEKDRHVIDFWDCAPYNVLFVDGNHCNFNVINACPITEKFGGKVHQMSENITHLMRGEVYTICGKTIFTFGGAHSIDRVYRKENISWWPQEMPTAKEMGNGISNLQKVNFQIDYLLTHCADSNTLERISPYFTVDDATNYLKHLKTTYNLQYKHHFFGHYHVDRTMGDKEECLYDRIMPIDFCD